MQGDYDERRGYEEDHTDRDDYPEEVWEQIQAERRRLEGGDDNYLDDHVAAPEPEPEIIEGERLKELTEDFERLK